MIHRRSIRFLLALAAAVGGRAALDAGPPPEPQLVRGDSNGDGAIDVSDAVHVLVGLFAGGGALPCEDAADADDDGAVGVTDAVRLLGLLFRGGPELPEPAACGPDPTEDSLGCIAVAWCGVDPLARLSDTFDGGALDPDWSVLRPGMVDVSVADGALTLEAASYSLWFRASRGPLVFQLVTGDFRATARVHARRASAPGSPPVQSIHLGGLMARAPASEASGSEDYVFIVVGEDENDRSVETKTTRSSVSQYTGPSWPSGDAELRISRTGALFRLYKRPVEGGAWQLAASFDRPDLPETLQVGPFIYAASGSPDLAVRFDEVVFESPSADGG